MSLIDQIRMAQRNAGEAAVMADGISTRMERYEAIGNGQVPVVAAAAVWTLANA